MSKIQIIILTSAIVLIIALFCLPRIIINEGEKKLADNSIVVDSAKIGNMHTLSVPDSLKELVANLKLAFVGSKDMEKKTTFADSLATIFERTTIFDSALVYNEAALKLKPTLSRILKTADNYYSLFGIMTDPTLMDQYATKARELYSQVLEKDSSLLDVKAKLAMTYVTSSTPMKGILLLRKVVDQDPKNKLAVFNLGLLSVQSGQYDKAVERFLRLLEIAPKDYRAHYYLAYCYTQLGKTALAKQYIDQVINDSGDVALINATKQIQKGN